MDSPEVVLRFLRVTESQLVFTEAEAAMGCHFIGLSQERRLRKASLERFGTRTHLGRCGWLEKLQECRALRGMGYLIGDCSQITLLQRRTSIDGPRFQQNTRPQPKTAHPDP